MKNKQTHQHYTSAESTFKVMGPMMCSALRIKFSDRCNAKYGSRRFFRHLFDMCVDNEYAETSKSSANQNGSTNPSARWTLGKIRDVRYDHMLTRCHKLADQTVKKMRRQGMLRQPMDIAIDKHHVPRYDRFDKLVNVIKSYSKKGTCYFNSLATANSIVDGQRAFLKTMVEHRGDTNLEIVSGLIRGCQDVGVSIRSLKVDREFFSVDVLNMLYDEEIPFIVPAVKTPGVKKAVEEFRKGKREAVSRHYITTDSGDIAEFTLVILDKKHPKGDDDLFTLATSSRVDQVLSCRLGKLEGAEAFAEQYRRRWGIESAYKDYEARRPRTTSKNESVRMLLLFLPIFLYNAWKLTRYIMVTTGYKRKMTFQQLIETFIELMRRPDQTAFGI